MLGGIFSWLHPKQRMILLLHYTLDQKLCNLTYAFIFFWVTAPSLASPFHTNTFNCFGHSPNHVLSYCFPDPLLLTSRTQAMCISILVDIYRRLRTFLERREMFASFFFHVSNQVSYFSLFLTIILLQNFYDTPPDECVFGKCYFPFLVNRLRSFGRVSLSMVLVLVFLQGLRLVFLLFFFLDSARGSRV